MLPEAAEHTVRRSWMTPALDARISLTSAPIGSTTHTAGEPDEDVS
ncbi:hypothetical protein [Ilumatobacter coccineus]|nr:hypothetical protein [Ilumatobacter coccineus]